MSAGSGDPRLHSHGSALWDRPLLSAVVVTILASVVFPLSFIVDFKPRVGSVIDSWVTVRLLDVAFRMSLGAFLVLVLVPVIFRLRSEQGWLQRYLSDIGVGPGISGRETFVATALSSIALVVLISGMALSAGVFDWDPAVLIRDEQWVILLLALVPGVWEELTFRGIILTSLQRRYDPGRSVQISGALFGLFHLGNFFGSTDTAAVISGVVAAGLLGLGWGYLVVASGSVLPAVVLHYLVDVLLDAGMFIDPTATDDAVAPVYVGIVLLWPTITVFIARRRFHNLRRQ